MDTEEPDIGVQVQSIVALNIAAPDSKAPGIVVRHTVPNNVESGTADFDTEVRQIAVPDTVVRL